MRFLILSEFDAEKKQQQKKKHNQVTALTAMKQDIEWMDTHSILCSWYTRRCVDNTEYNEFTQIPMYAGRV